MQSNESLIAELAELKAQLQEANDTIEAIRTGQVDALVVKNENGHQLYTLKSADQTYRVFIEKMKEGAVTLNKQGVILYSNSQFAAMVNLPLSRVTGMHFINFISDQYRDDFNNLMEKGWQSDSKGELRMMNQNGYSIPFLFSFTSLQLDKEEALSLILTDLSIQKESENQLKQKNAQLEEARLAVTKINERLEELVKERTHELFMSREHFRFLADNIPVIVWTAKADGTTDYFNHKWFEYSGLNLEQSLNGGARATIHPEDIDKSVSNWNEAKKNKTKFITEYRLQRASDKAYRWHVAKGEPFKDEHGNILAWFGTITDIEEQKKELERKDEFISVASHELKTPLTSIKGYLQLMENQTMLTPADTKLFISKANIAVNKLQHLINDLLDVSRIEAGKLEFDRKAIDLSNLVNNCLENNRYVYSSYNIQGEVENGIHVLGNEDRLEQVLMNLLGNAVKYSPERKDIIVKVQRNGTKGIVSVTDFGNGILPDDQPRIFERFYRSDENKYSTQGLGMGLFISSEIIREHDGKIWVQSKPGEGSVFTFTLPLIAG
jgi:two-component system phosphate regulon sensor histidine kinase PhoR